MSIYEKLSIIQSELKAPKGQYNSYGGYKYRSCEDILEAVKPHLKANNCVLTINDEIVTVGERYYIKATACLTAADDTAEMVTNTAYAREEETKKGMDGSQITGTASSYARKYALNGLFCIDDTKDADTDEYKKINDAKKTETKGKTEGIHYKNFFGTHLTGPILIKNPYFLVRIAEILCSKKMKDEYLTYEKDGYEITLRELNARMESK